MSVTFSISPKSNPFVKFTSQESNTIIPKIVAYLSFKQYFRFENTCKLFRTCIPNGAVSLEDMFSYRSENMTQKQRQAVAKKFKITQLALQSKQEMQEAPMYGSHPIHTLWLSHSPICSKHRCSMFNPTIVSAFSPAHLRELSLFNLTLRTPASSEFSLPHLRSLQFNTCIFYPEPLRQLFIASSTIETLGFARCRFAPQESFRTATFMLLPRLYDLTWSNMPEARSMNLSQPNATPMQRLTHMLSGTCSLKRLMLHQCDISTNQFLIPPSELSKETVHDGEIHLKEYLEAVPFVRHCIETYFGLDLFMKLSQMDDGTSSLFNLPSLEHVQLEDCNDIDICDFTNIFHEITSCTIRWVFSSLTTIVLPKFYSTLAQLTLRVPANHYSKFNLQDGFDKIQKAAPYLRELTLENFCVQTSKITDNPLPSLKILRFVNCTKVKIVAKRGLQVGREAVPTNVLPSEVIVSPQNCRLCKKVVQKTYKGASLSGK